MQARVEGYFESHVFIHLLNRSPIFIQFFDNFVVGIEFLELSTSTPTRLELPILAITLVGVFGLGRFGFGLSVENSFVPKFQPPQQSSVGAVITEELDEVLGPELFHPEDCCVVVAVLMSNLNRWSHI